MRYGVSVVDLRFRACGIQCAAWVQGVVFSAEKRVFVFYVFAIQGCVPGIRALGPSQRFRLRQVEFLRRPS